MSTRTQVAGQLDLLEMLLPPAPTGPFICQWCGTESPNEFLHNLNHGTMGYRQMCVSMSLTQAHALNAVRQLSPATRTLEQCFEHPAKRKPCAQECWEAEYKREVEIAEAFWGTDGWRV